MSIQTTGIHPKTLRLVNLGVSAADGGGNIVDTQHVVINPTENPDPTHLHGLEPADFERAPRFGVIQAKLAHALDGCTLAARNAPLVWGFIVAEAKKARRQANHERSAWNKRGRRRTCTRVARIPAPARIVDTLETAHRQGKRLDDARLRAVACAYGLDVPSSEASIAGISVPERVRTLGDVTTTLALFRVQGGLDEGITLNIYTPDQLREDIVGLQRSAVCADVIEAPRPVENPGRYTPGRKLAEGMEFVMAPEMSLDPDELIETDVRAGLAYSEKVMRESSVLVCNRPTDVTPDRLMGKAIHAHREDIPIVSDEVFLRLVGEMKKQGQGFCSAHSFCESFTVKYIAMKEGTSHNDVSDHSHDYASSPSLRARFATATAHAVTWVSRKSGCGAGGMIGGLIMQKIDPRILASLGKGRPAVIVTDTNGKSTTTRMFAAAIRADGHNVATNEGGDSMDAGIISALLATPDADSLVLEADELHVPHIAEDLKPQVLVLLNLSCDQFDRVDEIDKIEATLCAAVDADPQATVTANCDDPSTASAAWDAKKVIWVSAGGDWTNDATSSPRTGGPIIQDGHNWYAARPLPDGLELKRPKLDYRITAEGVITPASDTLPANLTLPGNANRGNAILAIMGAADMGADLEESLRATETVDSVTGRYFTTVVRDDKGGKRHVRMLLAKNPAGWQEALSMVDRTADAAVIAVNGHIADSEDLSWLWDVRFEDFDGMDMLSTGERGTGLAVRLLYAGIDARLVANPLQATRSYEARGSSSSVTRVEVLANYIASRDLEHDIERAQEEK